jgi:transposase
MQERPKATSYTAEFRASAVTLAVESGRAWAQTARDWGISKDTLYGWIRQGRATGQLGPRATPTDPLQEELKRLRRENALLRQERDILKKAAAYFAKTVR